jgi:hypothetical protein
MVPRRTQRAHKGALAGVVVSALAAAAERTRLLLDDPAALGAVLKHGAARVFSLTDPVADATERIVDLLRAAWSRCRHHPLPPRSRRGGRQRRGVS